MVSLYYIYIPITSYFLFYIRDLKINIINTTTDNQVVSYK